MATSKRLPAGKIPETEKPIIHGVRPQTIKRKLRVADPTAPGAGAGSFPNLLYRGGPVINTPQVYVIFVGDWTSVANQSRATRLTQFVTDLLNSSYMNILSQYGCGSTGTVANSIFLSNTISSLTHANITTLLQNAIDSAVAATHIPEPSGSAVHLLFLDDSTGVDDTSIPGSPIVLCDSTSDDAFGYHLVFTTTAGNPFYFGIIGGLTATCLSNSCPGGDSTCTLFTTQTQEQRQTAVASHELSEMISNPFNTGITSTSKLAWIDTVDPQSGEIGDICAGKFGTITVGANTWTVQLMYSKLDDMQTNGATTCVASETVPLPSLLPAVSLIVDRSTFGKDEVNALLGSGSATITDAFYVVVEGFTPDELGLNAGNLNAPPNIPTFAGTFAALMDPAMALDAVTGVQLEQPGKFWNIQRITFPFNITFSSVNAFAGLSAATPSQTYGLTATVSIVAASSYPALSATSGAAAFELVFQADPFMSAGETWWLSDDIRVFQVVPAILPASGVPLAFSSTAYGADPNAYIKSLISELNTNFTDPATANTPFNAISTLEDQSGLNLAGSDLNGHPSYDFALARVHLRGDTASNVRVFFRLFISSSPDTDFNHLTTFRSLPQTDATGAPIAGTLIPLLGYPTNDMSSTIPFFAEPRIDATAVAMTRQTDPANVQTVPSPTSLAPPAPGAESYAYFGCWLDVNQTTARFPLDPSTAPHPDGPYGSTVLSIQSLIMSNHACLVAEIAYDPDPIPPGANASTSDKIGQRNLNWTTSDNPGPLSAHRIPTLFDLRPTRVNPLAGEDALPDELMIEWGGVPVGSLASIYWPQVSADAVIELSKRVYSTNLLSKSDANTIQCTTGSVTYIPIPADAGPNFAGLFTLDLPLTVTSGQEFNIVARRVVSRGSKRGFDADFNTGNWRYVAGAFQIRIPVAAGPALLKPEESLLAVFKWKLEQLPAANRWHPVLQRYIGQLSGRVDGFGGNAGGIPACPQGFPGKTGGAGPGTGGHGRFDCVEFTGKVSAVAYDRFGDFEGFTLMTERGEEHCFQGKEREIEKLVRQAWMERTVISVVTERHQPHWPASIILRRPSRP